MPATTKTLVLRKTPASEGQGTWHATALVDAPLPELEKGQLLLRVRAAGFNRRDLWMRYGQYPGIRFDEAMGSDAAGEVVKAGDPSDDLLHKRVMMSPVRAWKDGPSPSTSHGLPEVVGGGPTTPAGVFSEYIVVDRAECLPTPGHLDDEHAAAWPLGGLTAWRACMVNAQIQPGNNVLITGIGGGVAVIAAQLCIARGAHVYVTSGSEDKISRAKELGVKGGVNYKSKEWPAELQKMLTSSGRPHLDAVIDSGGGDIMGQTAKLLKPNGRLVCYGMTANPKIVFTMREVLKNLQLIGSTMGSTQDWIDSTRFMEEHKIVPVVSHVLDGLDSAEQGFDLLKSGEQFGKIIIRIGDTSAKETANL